MNEQKIINTLSVLAKLKNNTGKRAMNLIRDYYGQQELTSSQKHEARTLIFEAAKDRGLTGYYVVAWKVEKLKRIKIGLTSNIDECEKHKGDVIFWRVKSGDTKESALQLIQEINKKLRTYRCGNNLFKLNAEKPLVGLFSEN